MHFYTNYWQRGSKIAQRTEKIHYVTYARTQFFLTAHSKDFRCHNAVVLHFCLMWKKINCVWHFESTWLQLDFWTQQQANIIILLQITHNVLTAPDCSQSMRACAVSVGICALRPSLSSWLVWSSKASFRSSANCTTCRGPALTGEPRSYMLLENSTAAALEPREMGWMWGETIGELWQKHY